jgi:hypothetical protein
MAADAHLSKVETMMRVTNGSDQNGVYVWEEGSESAEEGDTIHHGQYFRGRVLGGLCAVESERNVYFTWVEDRVTCETCKRVLGFLKGEAPWPEDLIEQDPIGNIRSKG